MSHSNVWLRENPEKAAEMFRQHYSWKQSAIATWKLERGCADCGYDESPEALDFDHCTGIKFRHLGAMKTYSIDRIIAEMEKCEVVCANCHRLRTAERRAA